MSNRKSKAGAMLSDVTDRVEETGGKVSLSRYHRAPHSVKDDYILDTKVLGSGCNGKVYRATGKENNHPYAVKFFKLRNLTRDKMEELEAEVEIFLLLDHPHIARLVDVYEEPAKLCLVMECMTGGELFARIVELKRFAEKDAACAAWQILLAVNYLHAHNVVHRDLKPENFMYESTESGHLKND